MRLRFQARHRLTHALQFQAVQRRGVRRSAGAVHLAVLPNNRPHWRLGLSIGKRAGPAVTRNRLKRLVREAFRLSQGQHPLRPSTTGQKLGFDVVVALRADPGLPLEVLRGTMLDLMGSAAREWERRLAGRRGSEGGQP